MKVSVRVVGDGLTRAEALAEDMRRRAVEQLEARLAAHRDKQHATLPRHDPGAVTPSTR